MLYINGYYYWFSGNGYEYVNSALATNGWNKLNALPYGAEGPSIIFWNGWWWWLSTELNLQAYRSTDLTNWVATAPDTALQPASSYGANDGGWREGVYQVDSVPEQVALVTNGILGGSISISASQLTGTIPLANENPNVVTNTETGVTLTGTFTGNGGGLTNLNANNLASGTVPLARLSGITSNQLDAATWQLATNLNGGNAQRQPRREWRRMPATLWMGLATWWVIPSLLTQQILLLPHGTPTMLTRRDGATRNTMGRLLASPTPIPA